MRWWLCTFALACAANAPVEPHLLPETPSTTDVGPQPCRFVESGPGPTAERAGELQIEVVAEGLTVPWGLDFLPDGDLLLTERPGRISRIRDGERLLVADLSEVVAEGEGGLLGLALHPDFPRQPDFFIYLTTADDNRVERWTLAPDGQSAERAQVLLEGIGRARFHNGGRLRFGPDRMLYISTGDAQDPARSADPTDPAGSLLRIQPDGRIPDTNPTAGSPVFVRGIRNSQGFDWDRSGQLYIADHGPTGELGQRGQDAVFAAQGGDDLGWPQRRGCQAPEGAVTPLISWRQATPPGDLQVYRGGRFAGWEGDLLMPSLGGRHLQRILVHGGADRPVDHEVFLDGTHGRLRSASVAPDGTIYLLTSNCDGRADCPPHGDQVLRIVGWTE